MENVWANPWFGIGLGDWERPWWMVSSTVDAFWLVIAMRGGIPTFLLLAIAILLIGRAVVNNQSKLADPVARRLAAGWLISLIALSLIGCTVHYWNVLHSYYFFFIGLAGWLADPRKISLKSYARRRQLRRDSQQQKPRLPRRPISPQPRPSQTPAWPQPGYGPAIA